jgi:hypothetical protein
MLTEAFDSSITRQMQDSETVDLTEEGAVVLRANAHSDVANQLISSRPVQTNNELRIEMQGDVGPRSRTILPEIVRKHVDSDRAGIAGITNPQQLRIAMVAMKKKQSKEPLLRPAAAFASFPVVSAAGMMNSNDRVYRNGLNPTNRRAARMNDEELMARRLHYHEDDDDPIDVTDQHHHQPPPPPPRGNQPLSPSPPSKRVKALKQRIVMKSTSLDSDDDDLSLYEDMVESFNDPSHPRHLTNIGMSRDSVKADEDDALKAVVRYNINKRKKNRQGNKSS